MSKNSKRAESRCRYYVREQATRRGWNPAHPSKGGNFLEEQEITNYFPDINLGLNKPDFLLSLNDWPIAIIEAKNEAGKIDKAISEAIQYAEEINHSQKYYIQFAIGAAGEESKGFVVETRFLMDGQWIPLTYKDFEITTIPSQSELQSALATQNGKTSVEIPSAAEFIDAAIELSRILRTAKVEAPLRPKVIGALTLAIYQGDINFTETEEDILEKINKLIKNAIDESDSLDEAKKNALFNTLKLQGSDYQRLDTYIIRIINLMKSLNIKAVLQTDTDFLGLFYEAFLRYGYDNNALGIVFTPRHITRFCAQLAQVIPTDTIADLACGTGGFLVAAFDMMMQNAHSPKTVQKIKKSIYGFDTNPTIWALATLNMFFRGDGKSNIYYGSCLDKAAKAIVQEKCTKAFLNPPFSQDDEPERDFINASMEALQPEGILVCVVKAGIFADDENSHWRKEFQRNHSILGLISLPDDLFYPTAAPTTILIARAHIPQLPQDQIFISRIWNDGFTKLKGKRIECPGSQLEETLYCFQQFKQKANFKSDTCQIVDAALLLQGEEWSPQKWLKQPPINDKQMTQALNEIQLSLFKSVTFFPDLTEQFVDNFPSQWDDLPNLPYGREAKLSDFFHINNGKSVGEKNYLEGEIAYISSGDNLNSIIRLVKPEEGEVFTLGGITVTAFGQAYVQPWRFMARGNGGSSVRVLTPKFKMNFKELCWFAAQINIQKWRIFYGRMAIKGRLQNITVTSPPSHIVEHIPNNILYKLNTFKNNLQELSDT